MTKPVIMTPDEWKLVWESIKKNEKPSVFLSRNKMKEKLGFVNRNHTEWVRDGDYDAGFVTMVCLDFYDEQKRVMFLLKYGNGKN